MLRIVYRKLLTFLIPTLHVEIQCLNLSCQRHMSYQHQPHSLTTRPDEH